jgi:4-hydroxy-tetrahydrodipicolinate reductase
VATAKLAVGLHGASGRMELRLVQLAAADPDVDLVCALERPGHPQLGSDVGTLAAVGPLGLRLRTLDELDARCDVIIDFSHPSGSLEAARFCARTGAALVVGTTGFSALERQELEKSSTSIPLLVSPNMSRSVNLLMRLVAETARALGDSAEIEIVERHHKMKKDAPSGTAARLAEIAARERGISRMVHGREGQVGERPRDEIGIHALRGGDVAGEHTVVFSLMGETLELTHRACNRDGFARGAIDAAKFLAGKAPGLYSMADVLG